MSLSKTPAMGLIAAATRDIDVEEVPRGSNAGPRINQMLARVGLGPGYFWCAAAVSTWGYEAAQLGGFTWPLPLTADCDVLLAKAKKLNALKTNDPQPADVFLVLKPGDPTDAFHTGIVVKSNGNGTIETIEGNSNLDGSNNGYEVAHKAGSDSRRLTSNLRFIRWQDLVKSATTPWIVDVEGIKQAQVWTDPLGSVWAEARPFVFSLQHTDSVSKTLDFNSETGALMQAGRDLPVQAMLRGGTAFSRVRDLGTQFGGDVNADAKTQVVTVTRLS